MAAKAEITAAEEWHTGTDHVFGVTVYQSDGTTPQDITDWPLSWLLKQGHAQPDAAALVTKTDGDGITITNGPQGQCEIVIEADDTRDLAGGRYVHELKYTEPDEESVLAYGPAILKRSLHLDPPV